MVKLQAVGLAMSKIGGEDLMSGVRIVGGVRKIIAGIAVGKSSGGVRKIRGIAVEKSRKL